MNDFNVCEHCSTYQTLDSRSCRDCRQPLVLPAPAGISVWRLGDVQDGRLGPLLAELRRDFRCDVVLQPSFLDERPSDRPGWKGRSANVFLSQVQRRHARGTFLSLGVTDENIVSSRRYNFLFGLAFMDGRAAVMSFHPLTRGRFTQELLSERAFKIALHELGHALGLDHHAYEDGVDCTMVGDVEVDSRATLDASEAGFCAECGAHVERHVHRNSRPRRGGRS